MSFVGIGLKNEVRALILLSSLPESWNGTIIIVSSSSKNSKLKYNDFRNLILSEEIRRKKSRETSNSILNTENKGKTFERSADRGSSKRINESRSGKPLAVTKAVERKVI